MKTDLVKLAFSAGYKRGLSESARNALKQSLGLERNPDDPPRDDDAVDEYMSTLSRSQLKQQAELYDAVNGFSDPTSESLRNFVAGSPGFFDYKLKRRLHARTPGKVSNSDWVPYVRAHIAKRRRERLLENADAVLKRVLGEKAEGLVRTR